MLCLGIGTKKTKQEVNKKWLVTYWDIGELIEEVI